MKRTSVALISLYGVENTGIRSISSVLKADGFDVSLIFFKRWVNNGTRFPSEREKRDLVRLLKELGAGIAGMSFTSPLLAVARDLTRRIREELSIPVIWGGNHATAEPAECLNDCDTVLRGEGEYAVRDFLRAYAPGGIPEGIRNGCYRRAGGAVVVEEMRPLIQDLDSLPGCDYGSAGTFFIEGGEIRRIDPLAYSAELRVLASRGCPFACSYCYNSMVKKLYPRERYHRIRSVGRVLAEIESARAKFKGIRKIKFDDDTFIFPRGWIEEFSREYRRRIGLPFEILFNAEFLDENMLRDLRGAGLRRVQVGLQSGSESECAGSYNRTLAKSRVEQFARLSKQLGIEVVYDIILDNPLSTPRDREELIGFLLRLPRPFDLFVYSLTVFPGTDLCGLLLEKELIHPGDVEGAAHKSFNQFRLSLSYPRPREERFTACLVSLTSKSFIPRALISMLAGNIFLKKHPQPLQWFAQLCNLAKLAWVAVKMAARGELSAWKVREYGSPGRLLIQ